MQPDAAVAIVRARAPEDSILLMRRAERQGDPWSGHWSLPGGRREPGDPDLLHTALRELEEECGIRLSREHLESTLPHAMARRGAGLFLLVAPFLFRTAGVLPTVLDTDEAVEALWIPVASICDPARHALRPVPGRSGALLFPAIELNQVPLWGFTYRLLTDWLAPASAALDGFDAAGHVLKFLVARGLTPRGGWSGRVAEVGGLIPARDVTAHFSAPAHFHPAINCLEVQPDAIRVVGPDFEEYLIRSG
jgi:8-oxo-dGTP pyrophosphatase MutT (NUDIX family)